MPKIADGEAFVRDGKIVIEVSVSRLKAIIEAGPTWPDYAVVSDLDAAAKSFVRRLNDEGEDGTTCVHRAFDEAAYAAFEEGDEGFSDGADEEGEDD